MPFLFDYSRVTELRAFEELAGELLDEVVESVCLGMPVGLSFGWCGIGWGWNIWSGRDLWKMMIMKSAIRLMRK